MTIKELAAEALGTCTLVLALCAAAVLAASGELSFSIGASAAMALAIFAMIHALSSAGPAHFNPAVTLGLVASGRIDAGEAARYIAAQLVGAIAATTLFWFLAPGNTATSIAKLVDFASSYGSAGRASLLATAALEIVFTALFIILFMGATSRRTLDGQTALAVGLGFGVLHFIALTLASVSLNPARATAAALFAGPGALTQLWLFWVAPITGGIIGGFAANWLNSE